MSDYEEVWCGMKCQWLSRCLVLVVLFSSLMACGSDDGPNISTGTSNSPSVPEQPPSPPGVLPGVPTISAQTVTIFPSSPVRIFFSVSDYTIGPPGTPHLRFSIDGGPFNDLYIGTGNDPDIGVQLDGVHTHFAHWVSSSSFDLFGLGAGSHSIRFILVNGANEELPNPEAKVTYIFTVQQSSTGSVDLKLVLDGLRFPVSLAEAPDRRIFFNERLTGNVRVIHPDWQLDQVTFCSVSVQTAGEKGLLGLALDPDFLLNQTVYVYYTARDSSNRVSKLVKQSDGSCVETVILPNLPTSGAHNGGVIAFGPDRKLYVVIGDAQVPSAAQDPDSLAGKILRVNTDGSAASGNPFSSSSNARKVYSLGHRNSYGLVFHPSTGQLWESENGPSDNDEVNRIDAGGNYGWPIVGGITNNPAYRDPIIVFNPVIAPTGIVGIPSASSIYPSSYRDNLLIAAFNAGTIRLVTTNGTTNVVYPGGVGGLLSLMLSSDGYVYASNSSGVFRVVVNPH